MKKFGDEALLGDELGVVEEEEDGGLRSVTPEFGIEEMEKIESSQTCPVCSVRASSLPLPSSIFTLADVSSLIVIVAARLQTHLDQRRSQLPRRLLPLSRHDLLSRLVLLEQQQLGDDWEEEVFEGSGGYRG